MNLKEKISTFKDAYFLWAVQNSLKGCTSVLDVGCGANSSVRSVIKGLYSEGIDAYRPSIIESKRRKIHHKYIVGDISQLDKYYKKKSFDAVIAIDVIEHLKKRDSFKLLEIMESIAKKKIILLTPNGFCRQGHYGNNSYQDHKSGWDKKDLKKRGYRVYGLRSFKQLRGHFATIRYKPWLFWGFVAFVTEPLLYYFPDLSYDLFAVKTFSS